MNSAYNKEFEIIDILISGQVNDHLNNTDKLLNSEERLSSEKIDEITDALIKSKKEIIEKGIITKDRISREEALVDSCNSMFWYYSAKSFMKGFLYYNLNVAEIDPKSSAGDIFELLKSDTTASMHAASVIHIYENRDKSPAQYNGLLTAIGQEFRWIATDINDQWAYLAATFFEFQME